MAYYFTQYVKIPNVGTDIDALSAQLKEKAGQKITFKAEAICWMPDKYRPKRYEQVVTDAIGDSRTHAPNAETIKGMYTTFRIPKRSGGYRTIKAPNDALKVQQRNVVKYFKKDLLCLEHNCAYGFVEHRNCKDSLEVHQRNNSRWFLKLDFKDFFPSFNYECLMHKFRQIPNLQQAMQMTEDSAINEIAQMVILCTDENGTLVQGAPSSPYLANIAMIPFDYAVYDMCRKERLVYTRYADDILISSKYQFDWVRITELIKQLLVSLEYPNLHLSYDKTRYGSSNGANWNLGMMYNQDLNITVGHEHKHTMKVIAHKWDSLTQEEQQHWKGVMTYYRSIEPEYFSQERFMHI